MSTDAAQLTALYKRWHKPIRAWLRRRVKFDGVDHEDIAHEVFVRLLRYPQTQGNEKGHGGYIFQIAQNVASDYRDLFINRTRHARIDHVDEGGMCADERLTPAEITERDSLCAFVRAEVAQMPWRMRQCFTLYVNHDLTYKQIAAQLAITYIQVQHDLEDARAILRKRLA